MKPNLSIESNIRKMYAIRAIDWFLLMMPTVVLFFQENGLSMKDIFLLQAAYALAIVVFEMPTGYFADAYGRKLSLIVGAVLAFFGMAAYSFSYTFWGFLAAEILMGIGSSFTSGADSALLYDTLLQSRKEKSYKSIEGKYTAIGNFSEGTAATGLSSKALLKR
ncbi:MFS transporter [Candidatus Woesearchaeota archaeon]|nr:MFS transporter [Candidatus Woesearchaeota archaeon]